MAGKRKKRGVLVGMVKYPKTSPKKHRSLPAKILVGFGWGVLTVLLVLIVIGGVLRIFQPRIGAETKEAVAVVTSVDDNPRVVVPGSGTVAHAILELEGVTVALPLTATSRPTVDPGATLHVRYEHLPAMRQVKVLGWELRTAAPVETEGER